MGLTRSQVEKFRGVDEAMKNRGIALLTGGPNGKTKIMHQALELLANNDKRLVLTPQGTVAARGYTSRKRHAEDALVEYFPRIFFSRQSLTVQHVMRQVLTHAGLDAGRHTADVVMNYESMMRAAAQQNRVISLAIDNAELLPTGAFTILKALNEYHDPRTRRAVGVGLLIAGDTTNKKFWDRIPPSFRIRCTEVMMEKIAPEEMPELIEAMHPGHSQYFDREGMTRLSKCNSVVEMKRVIDVTLAERKHFKYAMVGADLIEDELTKISLMRRKAA